MLQPVTISNCINAEGFPTGGFVEAVGLQIRWQEGPIGWPPDETKINGTFLETVIAACIQRLGYFQSSNASCTENEQAIGALQAALDALEARVARRARAGIQGTYQEGVAPTPHGPNEGGRDVPILEA